MRSGDESRVPVGMLVTGGLVFAMIVVASVLTREQSQDPNRSQFGDASGSVRDDSAYRERYRSAWMRVNAADVIKQDSITNRALEFVATINGESIERYEADVSSGDDGQQCVQVVPRGDFHVIGSDVLLLFREDGELIRADQGM